MYLGLAILRQEEAQKWPSRSRLRDVERHCARALERNDRLAAARLARAITLAHLKRLTSARVELRRLRTEIGDYPIAQQFIAGAERELRPWDLTLRFGLNYDTNVPQLGRSIGIPREFGREEDVRFGSGFDFAYQLYADDRLEFGIGGGAFGSWHGALDVFDEQTYRSLAYVGYRATDWLEAGLRYEYDLSFLGRENYLSRHRVRPEVSILQNPWGRTAFFYEFEPRDFFEVTAVTSSGPFDRTGDTHAFGVSQTLRLGKLFMKDVVFEVGFRHEDVSTHGTEYDSRNEILTTALTFPLPWDLTLTSSGEWAWEGKTSAVCNWGIG